MMAWSQSIHPSGAIVLRGPVHPLQDSWQFMQTPFFEYLLNGHSERQNLPSLTFLHE